MIIPGVDHRPRPAKKNSNFIFQILIQLDLVVYSRIFFLVNFYVINLLFKKKKIHRSWPMVDRHLDDHTGRGLSAKTGEEKNPKFYFAIYI